MRQPKREHPAEKPELHPRSKHRGRYDFTKLIVGCPELAEFVKLNDYGDESVDFCDPQAVKTLNRALLKFFYDAGFWEIPPNYLCPPIPGRADYIHYAADLPATVNDGRIPTGKQINCLDIGVGANCIYPIIGAKEYGWSFVGSDVDAVSIASANKIIAADSLLKNAVECRLQTDPKNIFHGVIGSGDFFDLTVCSPPFHSSGAKAKAGTLRKPANLSGGKAVLPTGNFGGQNSEL